jgi:hypothetical protein
MAKDLVTRFYTGVTRLALLHRSMYRPDGIGMNPECSPSGNKAHALA